MRFEEASLLPNTGQETLTEKLREAGFDERPIAERHGLTKFQASIVLPGVCRTVHKNIFEP